MQTFFEALWKRPTNIMAGWNPEPGIAVTSYNVYVGIAPVLVAPPMVKLISNIPPSRSDITPALRKVAVEIQLSAVQAALGLSSDVTFANKLFYFTITYNQGVIESLLSDSILVPVPPMGIGSRTRDADNPTYESYLLAFSDENQNWPKVAASSRGAIITDTADFYKFNMTTEYIYGADVTSTLSYPSDQTVAGSPAKLTTYYYSGGLLSKVVVTDSTI